MLAFPPHFLVTKNSKSTYQCGSSQKPGYHPWFPFPLHTFIYLTSTLLGSTSHVPSIYPLTFFHVTTVVPVIIISYSDYILWSCNWYHSLKCYTSWSCFDYYNKYDISKHTFEEVAPWLKAWNISPLLSSLPILVILCKHWKLCHPCLTWTSFKTCHVILFPLLWTSFHPLTLWRSLFE